MDRLVDLDAVAAELQARRPGWESRGLKVGAFTWRDAQALWPQPIVTDRALVADPESLGMTMDASPGHFATNSSAFNLRSDEAGPTSTISAPSARVAAFFTSGAFDGITITALAPSTRAA